MHLRTIVFRDMQLLTMEEANVYEKKEKGQKSLRALQNQVRMCGYRAANIAKYISHLKRNRP